MAKAQVRHILVTTKAQSKSLMTELNNGADFGELAAKYSKCPTGKRAGGDLGEFDAGSMVPEFDTVAFSAPIGELTGPVKTQFGYHIMEVLSRTD